MSLSMHRRDCNKLSIVFNSYSKLQNVLIMATFNGSSSIYHFHSNLSHSEKSRASNLIGHDESSLLEKLGGDTAKLFVEADVGPEITLFVVTAITLGLYWSMDTIIFHLSS